MHNMFGYDYALTMGSRNPGLSEATIPEILSCPSVAQIAFPASLAVARRKSITINSAHEFLLEMIPKVFRKGDSTIFYLDTESCMMLEIWIAKKVTKYSGHNFILRFNRAHVKQGIVTVEKLKQVIAEVGSLLDADWIRVLHLSYTEWDERPDGSKAVRRPKAYHGVELELEWFMYYSPADLVVIGRERFENLRTCYEKYDFRDGIMVILQEEPFDKSNPEHVARRLQAEKELGFDLLPDEPVAER